ASPSKKRTLVTVKEEEPKPAKKVVSSHKTSRKQSAGAVFRDTPGVTASKKKTPTTTDKSKGIELLSDVVALEAAQLKKVIKRSKQDTSIHQADGSSDGTGSKPGVPDEPKRKFGDSGGEANVQGDDEDVHDSDDDPQQADDERTDSENQETNDDEGKSDDKFVHTPPNYVPTDDETNDESNDVD
ncbi:hypothetical protein Tco_0224690, partial [Tanacetum coccineum]